MSTEYSCVCLNSHILQRERMGIWQISSKGLASHGTLGTCDLCTSHEYFN